jgi:uncharacterized membrane protein (DUF2068 family)
MIDRAFGIFFFVLAIITFLLGWGAQWVALTPSFALEILLGLSITTLLIFFLLKQVSLARPQTFVMFYLFSIFTKFLCGGVAVFVILLFDKTSANSNAVFFLICYVAFTSLEVVGLWLVRKE